MVHRASHAVKASQRLAAAVLPLLVCGCGLLNWSEPPKAHHGSGGRHGQTSRAPAAAAPGGYVVQRGDTLYSIAFRNQLDYHDVADWNGIGRDYTIHVGQTLRLQPPAGVAPLAPPASSASPSTQVASLSPAAVTAAPPAASALPPADAAVTGWKWPTDGTVAQRFAPGDGAKGIDIAGQAGQVVVAAAPGKVVYSGSALKGYGELIIIKHNEQYLSAYGYNSKRLAEEGQQVVAGQPIAELGLGPEQKPRLHFEIRDKGKPVDPLSLLPAR